MKEFSMKLNYEHPVCSLVLDLGDENWKNIFSQGEINEINKKYDKNNSSLNTIQSYKVDVVEHSQKRSRVAISVQNHGNFYCRAEESRWPRLCDKKKEGAFYSALPMKFGKRNYTSGQANN
ncbi:hypothetical protein BD770DRAFT_406822 [Pilaira anomala]|nr:hypothetical protein BD770DRAFT_406822 [Pilaira anomala]